MMSQAKADGQLLRGMIKEGKRPAEALSAHN